MPHHPQRYAGFSPCLLCVILIPQLYLQDLSIGMKENTVFSVFHPDAMDLYNSCSDLQKICYDLADPQRRLNDEVNTSRDRNPDRMSQLSLFNP